MKFFKKEQSKKEEPNMKCWNCDQLISHKKVEWEPRKVGWKGDNALGTALLTNMAREIEKTLGNKDAIASPNEVFGLREYEYRGQCPECNATLAGFWFGQDSLSRNKNIVKERKPFFCHECKNQIDREFQVFYSNRIQEGDAVKELLLTICPKCNTEQGYPFEYNLEYGIIK